MKFTKRSPAIENVLEQLVPGQAAAKEKNQCVFCKSPLENFRDALSEKEAGISGMCQACQDNTFGK